MTEIIATDLTIGRLAKAAEVNVETIRYYQRVGLLDEPPKPADGYRHYPTSAVERLFFIRRAQRLGFKLNEIAELLELGDGHCDDVRARAESKRDQVITQIQDLQRLHETLDELIDSCRNGNSRVHCPIVASLGRAPRAE